MKSGLLAFEDMQTLTVKDEGSAESYRAPEGLSELLVRFGDEPVPRDGRFSLKSEAFALQLAHANNKILSLSNSRTRILAHQVESTHRVVNSLHHRFILADEVGLGKTIEAGLIIKEFIYRYGFKRILIVCPASLLLQWQHEMESKFNEHFSVLDRRALMRAGAATKHTTSPWKNLDRVICSLDFIKNKRYASDLKKTRWDAVIFDEAHRLRRDSMRSTLSYNVAEIIAGNSRSLLLLTATPFRGKIEELYYLVRLVDRNLLGPFQSFYNEYCLDNADLAPLRSDISRVLIRRTKKEVGGFTSRHATTVRFELHPDERALYDATTRYVIEEFNRSLQTENRAVGFVMTVFQKLLDSSSFALRSALDNRRKNLTALLERENAAAASSALSECGDDELFDIDELEDPGESTAVPAKKNADEIGEEIATLGRLVALADRIERNKKGEKLRALLKKLKREGRTKFLIFTQFRTTQDYLARLLCDYKVGIFNGSMDRERKEDAIRRFRDEMEILICTEAGGEGRNLQFCNILINYDLPWSPLKIEQRIGRIHRFGQPSDVFIYNFSTKGTVAERVLEVLTHKLKLFEESIGVPDVLLGQFEDEVNLTTLFMDMVTGRRSKKSVMSEMEATLEKARRSYEKLEELTVAKRVDFNYDEYYRITLKERHFSNRRIESFLTRLQREVPETRSLLCRADTGDGLYALENTPGCGEKGRLGTFDSARALDNESLDFLAFGHPAVDHLFSYCREPGFGGFTGIRTISHYRPFVGLVVYFLVTLGPHTPLTELVPVIVDPDNVLHEREADELEAAALQQEDSGGRTDIITEKEIYALQYRAREFFERAEERLKVKIGLRVKQMEDSLDLAVDPEIEKIRSSYERKLKELEEQLERQRCQSKWFGRNMKSAIGKTRNEIARAENERERLLADYSNRRTVVPSICCLSAGILITRDDTLS